MSTPVKLDPGINRDLIIRKSRDLSLTFRFVDTAGDDYALTDTYRLDVYATDRSATPIFSLTEGSGLTKTGNQIVADFTEEQLTIDRAKCYWELVNLTTNRNWFQGKVTIVTGESPSGVTEIVGTINTGDQVIEGTISIAGDDITSEKIIDALEYTPANDSAVVKTTGDQIIAGIKTFTSGPIVPTQNVGTNNTQAASTAFVQGAISVTSGVYPKNVKSYGAVGDGETFDAAAINAAAEAAGEGGVVIFPPGTYILDREVDPLNCQKWIGFGATSILKRRDGFKTELAAAVAEGSKTITVADASGFAVGETICINDPTSPFGGKGYGEFSNFLSISAINGNELTVLTAVQLPTNNNLASEYPIGSACYRVMNAMIDIKTQDNYKDNIFEGLTFDGNGRNDNATNNDWNWDHNTNVVGSLRSDGLVVRKCRFINNPTGSFDPSINALIEHNYFENLGGGAFHISADTADGYIKFLFNRVKNVNQINQVAIQHEEAVITNSANSCKIIAIGNEIENANTGMFIWQNGDDREVMLAYNNCKDMSGIMYNSSDNTFVKEKITIIGNNFYNCGDILITVNSTTATVAKGWGKRAIDISNNTITNGRIGVYEATDVKICNNKMIVEDDFTFSAVEMFTGISHDAIIKCRGGNMTISGNTLYNNHDSYDGNCFQGISIINKIEMEDESGALLDVSYFQNIDISHNQISGFAWGIRTANQDPVSGSISARLFEYVGYQCLDNIIHMPDYAEAEIGIVIEPGVVAMGNKVYTNANCTFGILNMGARNFTEPETNGGLCIGNFVFGLATTSIQHTTGTNDRSNAVTRNNYVTGAVTDGSGGNSDAPSGTVTLPITTGAYNRNLYRTNTSNY